MLTVKADHPTNGTCPHCGYCPHCGRTHSTFRPWLQPRAIPLGPAYPLTIGDNSAPWVGPHYETWTDASTK